MIISSHLLCCLPSSITIFRMISFSLWNELMCTFDQFHIVFMLMSVYHQILSMIKFIRYDFGELLHKMRTSPIYHTVIIQNSDCCQLLSVFFFLNCLSPQYTEKIIVLIFVPKKYCNAVLFTVPIFYDNLNKYSVFSCKK